MTLLPDRAKHPARQNNEMTKNDVSVPTEQTEAQDADPENNKIDWTAVCASTCSWTFEELSHYAHSKVSPYIVTVARALCSQFSISAIAREELADIRQQLEALEAEDRSSRYVLHMLIAGDEGLTMLGICGILNAYFHSHALAEFFEVLAEMSRMPEALRPARARWMEIVRVCGKIQPPASFLSLAKNGARLGLAKVAKNNDLEESVGPRSVVGLIQGMSLLSTGEEDGLEEDGRIFMLCGRTAGWYAAIAEWMFGLKIRLTILDSTQFDHFKGNVVYSNCHDDQIQLTLAFNNAGIPVDGTVVDDPPMPINYHKEI